MATQNRFLHRNRIWDGETILTPSSEVATLPATYLQDQLRQKPWRTNLGWTIIAGFNDKLDFERPPGTPLVATIPAGTYVSGVDLAVAVTAALEAADAAPVWTCTYGVAAANKFRIAAGAPNPFDLMWSTGTNAATSIGKDLGFVTTANDTGTNTYTADRVAHQSRHYLKIHRSDSETIAVTAVALLEYNGAATSFEVFKIQGANSDSWASPPRDETITYSTTLDNPIVFFFGGDVRAWWRLLIEDVQNDDGYVELGVLYLGESLSPTINVSNELVNAPEDFSTVETGIDGTHFRDEHRRRDRWTLAYLEMEVVMRATLDSFESLNPVGKNFFFVWDFNAASGHGNGINGTTYGYLAAPFRQNYVPGPYWTYGAPFYEAL